MRRITAAPALLAVPLALALAVPASAAPASPAAHPRHRYVRVPYVAGRQFAPARRVIDRAGLRARSVPRGGEGIVAYEVPAAGKRVRAGSVVRLHMAATG